MENTLLIGLSRQMTLERQIDVVANNVANINTTGFKADRSLFEEYPRARARMKTISSAATAASVLRAGPRDLPRFRAGRRPSRPRTRSMSRSTATASSWCRPRPASATPATAACRSTRRASSSPPRGNPVLGTSGPIVFQPTDQDITIAADGNITVREGTNRIDSVRGKLRLVNFAQPQKLVKEGSNLYSRRRRRAPQPDTASQVRQGFIEKSNVNSVAEMSRMIEVTRAYTQISAMLQQQGDLRKTALEKLADVPA